MIKRFSISTSIFQFLFVSIFLLTSEISFAGKCTGSGNCSACSTCNYCKHCNRDGGSCGVCGGGDKSSNKKDESTGFGTWILIGIGVMILISVVNSNKKN